MDWKKLTETLTPYVDKAKEYGKKAAEFAENQIQSTPLFIQTQSEYDNLLVEKRYITIAYLPTDAIANDVRLLSSVWMTRAFMDNATLRFINIQESADLSKNLWLHSPLDMRVRFEGEETFCITDIESLKAWWKSPSYKKETVVAESSSVDPLA